MLVVFMALPAHAWLGISIMSATKVLAGDWYRQLDRNWGMSLLGDQQWGGGILWASGDLIGLLIFGTLFVQWVRAANREEKREDRKLDRQEARAAQPGKEAEEESELAAYNAMLARMNQRGQR